MSSTLSLEAKRADHLTKTPRLHFNPADGQYTLCGVDSVIDFTESLLWASIHRPVKIDHTALIVQAELETNEGKTLPILIKRSRSRNGLKALLSYLRPDRSRRAARHGRVLVDSRIPTARPLWTAGPRKIPGRRLARETYLAQEWLPGTENLHLWIRRLLDRKVSLTERLHRIRACAEQAGRMLGRMHAAGISHRDLKATNLLIHEPKIEPSQKIKTSLPDLWLIDMDGVRTRRFWSWLPWVSSKLSYRRRAADLGRLAVSAEAYPWITHSIRAVFLRAYASQFKPGKLDLRRLWHEVARSARRRLKKKRRRGREIY
ncbi:MAG: lipopolysaccharide kinase InaA family protein [Planctomycetia bacterium]|jgi:tRNA A-37 threonylcarbamoyl transferase component Bud32